MFGIKAVGSGLKGVQEAWPQISDLVDHHLRDEANLGPSDPVKRHQQRLQAEGMVAVGPEPPDPLVERARRLRAALAEAAGQAAEIEQLTQRIDTIDIYHVDEHYTGIQQELTALGMVSKPGHPDVRPELAPDLGDLLNASRAPAGGTG